jgi:hypothetical protein
MWKKAINIVGSIFLRAFASRMPRLVGQGCRTTRILLIVLWVVDFLGVLSHLPSHIWKNETSELVWSTSLGLFDCQLISWVFCHLPPTHPETKGQNGTLQMGSMPADYVYAPFNSTSKNRYMRWEFSCHHIGFRRGRSIAALVFSLTLMAALIWMVMRIWEVGTRWVTLNFPKNLNAIIVCVWP